MGEKLVMIKWMVGAGTVCRLYVGAERSLKSDRWDRNCCTWNTGFRTWLQLICCALACLTVNSERIVNRVRAHGKVEHEHMQVEE